MNIVVKIPKRSFVVTNAELDQPPQSQPEAVEPNVLEQSIEWVKENWFPLVLGGLATGQIIALTT